MKVVCITGGMGSGKSMVAKVLETLGYPVYYSDERAKQLY
ncbi:MAG: dephospho-CoA kinase, partial [Bacteroidia bacterium]|nr:dephospho-CoA kinase [Bacteroidia bacterium]